MGSEKVPVRLQKLPPRLRDEKPVPARIYLVEPIELIMNAPSVVIVENPARPIGEPSVPTVEFLEPRIAPLRAGAVRFNPQAVEHGIYEHGE
jgi:hypothetical protein